MRRAEGWVIVRGVLFLGIAFLAVVLTAALAYSGNVAVVVLYGVPAVAPAAIVCRVPTVTKAGDWWTFAYVSVWAAGSIVATVRDLVVSAT